MNPARHQRICAEIQEAHKKEIEKMTAELEATKKAVQQTPGDPCGILAAKDAEPVAYRLSPRYEDEEGYFDFTDSKKTADTLQARGWTITPLFTHPAHDDTALLRQALEAFENVAGKGKLCNAAIAALRERLGE